MTDERDELERAALEAFPKNWQSGVDQNAGYRCGFVEGGKWQAKQYSESEDFQLFTEKDCDVIGHRKSTDVLTIGISLSEVRRIFNLWREGKKL